MNLNRKRAAHNDGERVSSVQPRARQEYVKHMGGVDVADQRLGAHSHDHKPMTFFWRRIFDQKFAQAISNAYLLFAAWAGELAIQCTAALDAATAHGGVGDAGEGEDGVEGQHGCDLSVAELEEFQLLVKKSLKMERVQWDRRLANHLMSLCAVGNVDKGARRTSPVVEPYLASGAKSVKVCNGGTCTTSSGSKSRYKAARTRGVCWCNVCSDLQGKARALHLCTSCQKTPEAHVAAAAAAAKKKYTPISWAVLGAA